MFSSVVLRKAFLPLESVQLGRLVLNVDEPEQDFLDPRHDQGPEVIIKPQTNYSEVRQIAADRKFTSVLTQVISASRTKRNKTFTEVTTDHVTTYQLNNSGLWFKNAIKAEATRKWIEQAIAEGEDVYVVVGYHTLQDAVVVEGVATMSEARTDLKVPISLVATSAATPVAHILDPGIAGHQRNGQFVQKKFVATGEQIYAVQYRKVCFKWFSSRDLDSAVLRKEGRWKVYWDIRGQEAGTNDVLETDLQDELELEGDHEKYTSEAEGDFFF